MTVGDKQKHLCRVLPIIEQAAFVLGYDLVRGDARRAISLHGKFGEKKGYAAAYSVHKIKLAQDYTLHRDGKWITGKEAYKIFGIMHDIGDLLGIAKRIEGDLGHFSMEYQGHR